MSAEVALVYRVLPTSAEVNLDEVKRNILQALEARGYKVDRIEEAPIGFGITALRVYVRMPEREEYSSDEVEEVLSKVEGVGNIELEYFSRLGF